MNSIMQTLKGALSAQMNPHDARRQKEANQWLEKFQNDPRCVRRRRRDTFQREGQSCFILCGTYITSKDFKSFEQLKRQDPSMVLKLRVTLIAHVKRHKNFVSSSQREVVSSNSTTRDSGYELEKCMCRSYIKIRER